jgi:hypothetical protein
MVQRLNCRSALPDGGCGHLSVPTSLSPLELLHPDGVSKGSLVLGSNCPAILIPKDCTPRCEPPDLVLLGPSAEECRTNGWLEQAVGLVAQQLSSDGLAYLLIPSRWRRRVASLLQHHGLALDKLIVHFPDLESSRYLVPLDANVTSYALSKLIPGYSWRRSLAKVGSRLPAGKRLLGSALPSVGLAARRPGARPLFRWLFKLQTGCQAGHVVVRFGWRGQSSPALLYYFSINGQEPSTVAKIALTSTSGTRLIREAEALRRLGANAQTAGVRVPGLILTRQNDGNTVLLETFVEGHLLSYTLGKSTDSLPERMEELTGWIGRWNRLTRSAKPLDYERLNREVVKPASFLAPLLEKGREYQDWLSELSARMVGVPIPFVATHNDLTMYNILLDEHGQLGVVDWEAGREEGLPLVDFFYMLTDAVAAARWYVDRVEAFDACFAPGGTFVDIVARLLRHLVHAIEIPTEVIDLCFHACWLHHAVNEHHVSKPSDTRPFLQIVQLLALHRPRINWVTNL